ncbi:MAG: phosphoribosylformylglycinamidine synthase, partial [Magnetococcales bacterium]|nr:phosphoribosylformylglycinamidine synthase [Magnetococcales bacterium]
PILSIHDIGAGGLSNAVPEIIHDGGVGGRFDLARVHNDDRGMSPMEIWCNEAQERYVMAVAKEDLTRFQAICERERCPYAILGETTTEQQLILHDSRFKNTPIDMSLDVLLGKPPRMLRQVTRKERAINELDISKIVLEDAIDRVVGHPTVADKTFLITIGDRSVTGMINRDQMVGPWQTPVADVAVTARGFEGYHGEAMAMGERTPLALVSGPASARMAVGEALTNLAAADVNLSRVKLSANWMAPSGHPGEDANLYDTVEAVGMALCPALGISIPVGKDSLSMRTVWKEGAQDKSVTAPLSLIISAFTPVADIRKTMTPWLRLDKGDTDLILVDLGAGKNRLGGSILAQVHNQMGCQVPDLDHPEKFKAFFEAVQQLNSDGKVIAYHDRSDGGLLVTLLEMAFAGRTGLNVSLDGLGEEPLSILFSEELGAVLQVAHSDRQTVLDALAGVGTVQVIGSADDSGKIDLTFKGASIYTANRVDLHRKWSETTWRMQSLRDDPECAKQEYDAILDQSDPGMQVKVNFKPAAPAINRGVAPRVAILREQGINGQVEMAAAFHRAGFDSVDVTMSDILSGSVGLQDFKGVVACGGFSFGDVLGAGGGWAKTILFNDEQPDAGRLKDQFEGFFHRSDTFGLGVCNGCQMLSLLQGLIPGADHWPRFMRNRSEQFEARVAMVEIMESPSIFLKGMAGSHLPIACAHGEGRAEFATGAQKALVNDGRVALRYVDHSGNATEQYPLNPNGSPDGVTGVTTKDGRVTIMMPHPERVFRTIQNSWHPDEWQEDGPWMQMFRNARLWVS